MDAETEKRATKRKPNYWNDNQNVENFIDLTAINENHAVEVGERQKAATIGEDEPIAKRKTTLDGSSTQRIAFLDLTSSQINIHKTKAKTTATITSGTIIDVDQYIFGNDTTIVVDEPIAKRETTPEENTTQHIAFVDPTSSEININKMKAKTTATITSGAIIDVDLYIFGNATASTITTATISDESTVQETAAIAQLPVTINQTTIAPENVSVSSESEDEVPVDVNQYIFDNGTASTIKTATISDLSTVQETAAIAKVPVTINQTTIVPKNVSVFSGSEDEVPTDRTNTFIPHETVDIMPKPGLSGTYSELQKLEHHLGIVLNTEPFECDICFEEIEPNDGIVLRNCLHSFCKLCITSLILHGENIFAKCPYMDDDYVCVEEIQEREIRDLLTEEQFEQYLKRTISFAEQNTTNSFHCKKPDCTGWCECDDNVNTFCCPVCYSHNCINCGAIHAGKNCREYQSDLLFNIVDEESKKSIEKMMAKGAAMRCPKCQIIIVKRDGCDSLTCLMCHTQICWATKGFRWGPNGRGDTSGGCKCDWLNNRPCHPKCKNCH